MADVAASSPWFPLRCTPAGPNSLASKSYSATPGGPALFAMAEPMIANDPTIAPSSEKPTPAQPFGSVSARSATLIDAVATLRAQGLEMGYLSFQGSGACTSNGKAPWCVSTWGVDGGLSRQYPVPLPEFQRALGVPLQLYAPYFCQAIVNVLLLK